MGEILDYLKSEANRIFDPVSARRIPINVGRFDFNLEDIKSKEDVDRLFAIYNEIVDEIWDYFNRKLEKGLYSENEKIDVVVDLGRSGADKLMYEPNTCKWIMELRKETYVNPPLIDLGLCGGFDRNSPTVPIVMNGCAIKYVSREENAALKKDEGKVSLSGEQSLPIGKISSSILGSSLNKDKSKIDEKKQQEIRDPRENWLANAGVSDARNDVTTNTIVEIMENKKKESEIIEVGEEGKEDNRPPTEEERCLSLQKYVERIFIKDNQIDSSPIQVKIEKETENGVEYYTLKLSHKTGKLTDTEKTFYKALKGQKIKMTFSSDPEKTNGQSLNCFDEKIGYITLI
jgi:hypothetical protein